MPYGNLGPNWELLTKEDKGTCAIIVVLNAGGHKYYFSTLEMYVQEFKDAGHLHFNGCITSNPVYSETIDPFNKSFSTSNLSIEVLEECFPVQVLRQSGMILQDIDVEVVWFIDNEVLMLSQFHTLMVGKLNNVQYKEDKGLVSFGIRQVRMRKDRPVPSIVATEKNLPTILHRDDRGKPYPIIIGNAKRVPVLDLTTEGTGSTHYLVFHDVEASFVSGDTPVIAVYDGDDPATLNAQSPQLDADGVPYWRIDADDGAAGFLGRSVNVDVVGYQPNTLIDVIRFLITNFSNNKDSYDINSLYKYEIEFSAIELSLIFNQRETANIFDFITQRLVKQLPFMAMERAGKIYFRSLLWDREVVKVLTYDKNIIKMNGAVRETDIDQIRNSFDLTYKRSGLRDERQGAILKNWDNDFYCLDSSNRYGQRALEQFSAGDVSNEQGALKILNWYVDTYTKMRVMVSYELALECNDLRLWDTVKVIDRYQNWNHGPLFKVVGIRYGTGASILVDFMSVEDITEVYDVNRVEAETELPFIPPTPPVYPDDNLWQLDKWAAITYYQRKNYMVLPGAQAANYQVGANDFSVCIRFCTSNVEAITTVQTMLGVWSSLFGNDRSWIIYYYSTQCRFVISKDGGSSSLSTVTINNPPIHALCTLTARYQENGDGTSTMKLRIYNHETDTVQESTITDAVSPVYISSYAPFEINSYNEGDENVLGSYFIYWYGMYNGQYLSDAEIDDIEQNVIYAKATAIPPASYYEFNDGPPGDGNTITTDIGNEVITCHGEIYTSLDTSKNADWWTFAGVNTLYEGDTTVQHTNPVFKGQQDHFSFMIKIKYLRGLTSGSADGIWADDRTYKAFVLLLRESAHGTNPNGLMWEFHDTSAGQINCYMAGDSRAKLYNKEAIIAATFTYVGVGTSYLDFYIVTEDGVTTQKFTGLNYPTSSGSLDYMDIGGYYGGNWNNANYYWYWYRKGLVLTQQNIEDVFNDVYSPLKYHPHMYYDFRKDPTEHWAPGIRPVNASYLWDLAIGDTLPTKNG